MIIFFKCFFVKLNNKETYLITELRNLLTFGQIVRK